MTRSRLRREVAARAGCDEGHACEVRCAYCGLIGECDWPEGGTPVFREATAGARVMHMEHVIPESRNGPTSLDNTVIACMDCNAAKRDYGFGDPRFLDWLTDKRMAEALCEAEA